MAGVGKSVSLVLFYTLERLLFNRLVGQMGKQPNTVKEVMALWLVLEEVGFPGLIRLVQAMDNQAIEAFFLEGLLCLESISPDASEQKVTNDLPSLCSLCDVPINCRFFFYHREHLYKRYMETMQAVCNKIFGATAALEDHESGEQLVVRPLGERPSANGVSSLSEFGSVTSTLEPSNKEADQTLNPEQKPAAIKHTLNPKASAFDPRETPEEARTMFLTFSKGNPLCRKEIIWFFHSNWGLRVKSVFIEHPDGGFPPLFGKVIFNTSLAIPRILNGQSIAKYMVNGKHLWVHSYVPINLRSRRNQDQNH